MNIRQQFLELGRLSYSELDRMIKTGKGPNPHSLVNGMKGREYEGWNTAIPLGRGPKFIKGFEWEDGKVIGYNVDTEMDFFSSDPMNEPWRHKPGKDGEQKRFGWFDLRCALEEPVHNEFPNALLFDYNSIGRNSVPICGTMDYVVEVNEGDSRLLLGKFYLTPSFNNLCGRFDTKKGITPNHFLLLNDE